MRRGRSGAGVTGVRVSVCVVINRLCSCSAMCEIFPCLPPDSATQFIVTFTLITATPPTTTSRRLGSQQYCQYFLIPPPNTKISVSRMLLFTIYIVLFCGVDAECGICKSRDSLEGKSQPAPSLAPPRPSSPVIINFFEIKPSAIELYN